MPLTLLGERSHTGSYISETQDCVVVFALSATFFSLSLVASSITVGRPEIFYNPRLPNKNGNGSKTNVGEQGALHLTLFRQKDH